MAENTPPPSLVRKLAAVMGEVERIPKSGRNDFHKYDYATEADIVAAVRKGLSERGVMIVHKVDSLAWRVAQKASGEAGAPIATVHVTFTALDGDSGESLVVAQTVGEGQDSGDKAVYKALTGALKYAVLKLFLIPTGHNPEASKKPKEQRDPAPDGVSRLASSGAPTHFPKFGKGSGEAIQGATVEVLEFHLGAARKSLADAGKAKWHARDSALIGAIEAELARQRGAVPEGKQETKSAPAEKPPRIVDQQDGEAEEHAKQRAAGAFYHQAVKAGGDHGWEPKAVGEWLRKNRGRGGKQEVTAEDVALFVAHFEPPPEPGAAG